MDENNPQDATPNETTGTDNPPTPPPTGVGSERNESTLRGGNLSDRPRGDNWVWGIALIVIGALFLLQNLTPFRLINWWALFILIPAAGSFISAWRKYQENGRVSSGVRNSLFGGVIFTVVAAIFLLNLDLGKFWPIFVIAAGLAVMANALLPD